MSASVGAVAGDSGLPERPVQGLPAADGPLPMLPLQHAVVVTAERALVAGLDGSLLRCERLGSGKVCKGKRRNGRG